eukprot:1165557-Rhodomonas_salina.1
MLSTTRKGHYDVRGADVLAVPADQLGTALRARRGGERGMARWRVCPRKRVTKSRKKRRGGKKGKKRKKKERRLTSSGRCWWKSLRREERSSGWSVCTSIRPSQYCNRYRDTRILVLQYLSRYICLSTAMATKIHPSQYTSGPYVTCSR